MSTRKTRPKAVRAWALVEEREKEGRPCTPEQATVSWLVARARRAEELEGWLTWRAAWTGADGPKNKAGVPWWRSAIEGEKPPRGFDR